jgi:hypothetical protein
MSPWQREQMIERAQREAERRGRDLITRIVAQTIVDGSVRTIDQDDPSLRIATQMIGYLMRELVWLEMRVDELEARCPDE